MPVDNQRIAKNTLMLYMRMLLLMAVSLYTSRIVLASLGVNDFGIYNLIGGFITLFSFISSSLVAALQRYFNVSLGHNDKVEYQKVYSMGMSLFAVFSLIILLVGETVGLWFVKTLLNIPVGRESAAIWVYQVSLITMIVTLFRTPDNASIIAHEKMAFYAYVSLFEAFLKLTIVFILAYVAVDKLILYVLLYLASTIIVNLIYSFYCRSKFSECHYSLIWDKNLFKGLVSFSGWNMLSGGARVLKSQGDAFFLNRFYSVSVNAAFGVASQVYNAVNLFLTNYQTAFRPQLVQSYAAGDMDSHFNLVFRSAKFSYYLLLLIVVPVAFNLDSLLSLWLIEVPAYTKEFCLFILLAYLVDAIGVPLSVSVYANGNVSKMQITSALLMLVGLVLGYLCLKNGSKPFIIAVIALFIHITFWISYMYFSHKLCKISIKKYMRVVVLPTVIVSFIAILIPVALSFFCVNGWSVLVICLVDLVWVLTTIVAFGLSKDERLILCNQIYMNKQIRN